MIRNAICLSIMFIGIEQRLCAAENGIEQADSAQPNVVLFLIDDLGYMDLGCYGSSFYETPEIDALANRGMRFTNSYAANPVCSPTRAALMTGKSPQRIGITQWIPQPSDVHLPLDEVTIGEAMATAGYQNGYIGKWHLGEKDNQQPSEQGFIWMRAVNRAGQPGSYFYPFASKREKQTIRYWDVPDLAAGAEGDYLTDKLTEEALEFISQNKDRPFFLCFAHYAVHTPIQAPQDLIDKYERKLLEDPVKAVKPVGERNGAQSRAVQNNPVYAAMMENLDTNVGRVVKRLAELNLTNNTLIVFTSDNGGYSTGKQAGPTSCLPLRAGKGWTYEGGIRIPTILVWPTKINPAECAIPMITMDLYPTILDLTGQPLRPQQHADGRSLASAISGKPSEELRTRFLAWTYPHHHGSRHTPSNAIRAGDWKLIQLTDDKTQPENQFELYDLSSDVGETRNLADKRPEITNRLAAQLKQWLKTTSPAESN
jgi:arylsulfatase A